MAGSMANGVALIGDNRGGRPGLPHQRRDRSPLRRQHEVYFQPTARVIAEPPTWPALSASYVYLVCSPFPFTFVAHIPTAAPSPRGSEAPISTARCGSRMMSWTFPS